MLGFFFLNVVAYKAFAMGSFEPALTTFLLSFLKTDNSSTDYDTNSENIREWHGILSNRNSEVLRAQVVIVERIITSRYVELLNSAGSYKRQPGNNTFRTTRNWITEHFNTPHRTCQAWGSLHKKPSKISVFRAKRAAIHAGQIWKRTDLQATRARRQPRYLQMSLYSSISTSERVHR